MNNGCDMKEGKDSGNISKDGVTGLNSKSYFLVNLEQTIGELQLPDVKGKYGLIAVYMRRAPEHQVKSIAGIIDSDADYATHYRPAHDDDLVVGAFKELDSVEGKVQNLKTLIRTTCPTLHCGIAALVISAQDDQNITLARAQKDAYDAMLIEPQPAP